MKYTVFIGTEEISDYYMDLHEATEVCKYYQELGYDEIWLYNREVNTFKRYRGNYE